MRICQYCGVEGPDDPVLECWVDNEQYFLHRGCQNDWRAMDNAALPPRQQSSWQRPGRSPLLLRQRPLRLPNSAAERERSGGETQALCDSILEEDARGSPPT